jgi:hypothetical protein
LPNEGYHVSSSGLRLAFRLKRCLIQAKFFGHSQRGQP